MSPSFFSSMFFYVLCVTVPLCPIGQQFDDLKKAKEDVVDECAREKSAHKAYKKECAALKSEYNIIRLKVCYVNWYGGYSPGIPPPSLSLPYTQVFTVEPV